MIAKLKKGIKKKKRSQNQKNPKQEELQLPEIVESVADQDDYSKPSVDCQKKIAKLKFEAEAAIVVPIEQISNSFLQDLERLARLAA